MSFRCTFAGAVLSVCIMASAASKAATIYTDLASWTAAVGGVYASTSDTGIALFGTVTKIPLIDGKVLSVAGAADTLLRPLNGWGPWSGTFAGDIVDTTTNSETISFASGTAGVNGLGFDLAPDVGLFGPFNETFTVTLSDGTTTQVSGSYPAGTTQFVGFAGSNITSMTISATNAPDFAFGNFRDVPEPISMAVLASGLAALGAVRQRSRRR
jgi:PEP-CTERM motif